MKYYLKDKNGTVHTESQNSFKLAFKYTHSKDENLTNRGPNAIGSIKYKKNEEEIYLGTWSIGSKNLDKIVRFEGTTPYVEWAIVPTSNIITPAEIIINDYNLITKRNIKDDIIIKYNSDYTKVAPFNVMTNTQYYGYNNNLLTYGNITRGNGTASNEKNMNNFVEIFENQHNYMWNKAKNFQIFNRDSYTQHNSSNKTFTVNTVTWSAAAGRQYKADYFTIKKSDWNKNGNTKIRVRVKMTQTVINTGQSHSFTPKDLMGTIGSEYDFGTSYIPFIIVARTNNTTTLTDADRDLVGEYEGQPLYYGLMFCNGSTKQDTFVSYDDKNGRANRTHPANNSYKDFINYVQHTPDYYYTYSYTPNSTYICTYTIDDYYNYFNNPNSDMSIILYSDLTINGTTYNCGTEIRDLYNVFKELTGDENWYKTLFETGDLSSFGNFPKTLSECYDYSYCDSFYIEGYYDINISEIKDYLHICAPYVATKEGDNAEYICIPYLEMSIEGV